MKLVETRRVAFQYVTRKLVHGQERTRLNSVRMLFDHEEGGTDLYFNKTEDDFYFSRNETPKSICREIKYQRNSGHIQKYVNLNGFLKNEDEGFYDIYEISSGSYMAVRNNSIENYKRERSNITSLNEIISTKITSTYTVRIPKLFYENMIKNIEDPVYVITQEHSPRYALHISCMERDAMSDVPRMSNFGPCRQRSEDTFQYWNKPGNTFYINRFFMNYANLKAESELQIRMTGEHSMDIYVKDLYCKCCGKQLNPSEENVTKVTMCQTCSEAADILAERFRAGTFKTEGLKDFQRKLNKIVEEIEKMGGKVS